MTSTTHDVRDVLLSGLPVRERHIELAGIRTALLEGGQGPPLVLLHGPGEHAPKWLRILPDLVATHTVVAPDLPGHGESGAPDPARVGDAVLEWLDALIEATCAEPPTLVGQIMGGAIAARYAARHGDRIARLVLVDALGLAPFRPAPAFGQALMAFVTAPGPDTHDALWLQCAHDLAALRAGMGEQWEALRAYNLDRAAVRENAAAQQALMETFGLPAIPDSELARISVPTTLIWGRHDLATALDVAEAVSARRGWPLRIIDGAADDPPIEKPAAFTHALRAALEEA